GSSLIKGFAFNLAMGVLISMFSAITITKTLLQSFVGSKLSKNKFLFCIGEKKEKKGFDFVGNRKAWYSISIIMIISTFIVASVWGVNIGRDFTGGTLLNLKFEKEATNEEIAQIITQTEKDINGKNEKPATATTNEIKPADSASLSPTTSISIATEQADFGAANVVKSHEDESFIIRIKHISEENHQLLLSNLATKFGKVEEVRFSTIGPVIGKTIKEKATKALFIAAVMIVLYVAFAFRHIPKSVNPWRFGITTIIAVLHDLAIVTGLYIVVSHFLPIEVDSLFITAMLTILGYSVNDTIVVFDRIRENLKRQKAEESFDQIVNKSLNQTLARSINTSISTLLPLTAMYFLGGESVKYFVLALIFGTIVGTYSSIFIATNLLTSWKGWAEKKS
ncbi:protein translocase subunit SecF, partial [Patescibacteria group bacterium]|nr:protein translocase subunit SecF [Patescibacteria group bacterium]